jgi:phosphoribosyl 1,2-cyclic phosphodiesterase
VRVFVLGSGSSGNALLVESCGTKVMVDAGVGPRLVAARLAGLGIELRRGELHGIVATHHHGDHYAHADRLASAFQAPLYLHGGVEPLARSCADPVEVRRYEIGRDFRIGDVTVSTVQVPHDATQVAIRVAGKSAAVGVATDVGRVTPGLVALLADCDAALVEANHCTEMLAFSDYPEVVKRRVSGGLGHLSNEQTAELAARLVGSRLSKLWLGHLSRSNNTPGRALEVVASRARRIDVDVVPSTCAVVLDVRSVRPYQLGLPFA